MSATASAGPYGWDLHGVTWLILGLGVAVVVTAHRHLRTDEAPVAWTRHQILLFVGALTSLVLALTWPVADLAAHWSLTVLMVQRLLLVLGAAPLLILGLPYDVLERLTRPALVDAALVRLRRPAVAIATVTVLLVGSTLPFVVRAQASSPALRAGLDSAVLVAGFVLWLPVLGRVPGLPRLKPILRLGYLGGQGVIPAFLSFALILAPHPLYPTFRSSRMAIGLPPLNDQQIGGFVSKLTMIIVLLTVGTVMLLRADEHAEAEDPLVWADVQRHFERADRGDGADAPLGWTALPTAPPSGPPAQRAGGRQSEEP